MEMAITAWLGIDIAKQKFDVALNWNTRRRAKVFRNDAEGWQALLRWLKDLGVDRCMPAWRQPDATATAWRFISMMPGIASVSLTRPRSSTLAAPSWAATRPTGPMPP